MFKNKRWIVLGGVILLVVFGIRYVYAEPVHIPIPNIGVTVSKPSTPVEYVDNIKLLMLLTVLTLLPSIIIMTTSFIRIIIVLSLFKNAIGAAQAIPKQVLIGLALFLTFFIMMPTYNKINSEAIQPYLDNKITQEEAIKIGSKPIRNFMLRQTQIKDLKLFLEIGDLQDTVKTRLDERGQPVIKNGVEQVSYDEVPLYAVIPAFMISELKKGFEIGFLIYIPFIIIDIVTGSVLMSMGMFMVPPMMISLPFKLLLFVMVDGWHLLVKALVLGFK